MALLALALVPSSARAAPATTDATLDPASPGRTFEGVGGLSAGASSRLLIDYPEPARSRVLDALFRPGSGASLHHLKVEIGGDANSTDGSEHSHMRVPGEVNCDRGYEWWLMKEAKRRNPGIVLGALAWSFPGWVRPWSQEQIEYLLAWLRCARGHGLEIDNIGGWNERGFEPQWFKTLKAALVANGFAATKVVADDSFGWAVADAMQADPSFAAAVDVIGQHYPCGIWESPSVTCSSSASAQSLGKPLWASEQWWNNYETAPSAGFLARELNQVYVDGRMTATIVWPLVNSFYDSFPNAHAGLIRASEPWLGAWEVSRAAWTMAHTAQFAQPGWRYLDGGAGKLTGKGSFVTLRQGTDWSTIVETDQAAEEQQLRLRLRDSLSAGPVRVWSSDLRSSDPRDWFEREADVSPQGSSLTLTLRPGRVYSFTTAGGQERNAPDSPADGQWEPPFAEAFDDDPRGQSPPFFSDVDGAFEVQPCAARGGSCLRQQVTQLPVPWAAAVPAPRTVVGGPLWWGDYQLDLDVLFEQHGEVQIGGRLGREHFNNLTFPGYAARITSVGAWTLVRQEWQGGAVPLASGATTPLGTGAWHAVRLRFDGDEIALSIDGREVGRARDGGFRLGQVGFGTGTFINAQFDNLKVTPTSPGPRLLPREGMRASADGPPLEERYGAERVLDDNLGTLWHSQQPTSDASPHAITLDLGAEREVSSLIYEPRTDPSPNAIVTSYAVETSIDGRSFKEVAAGSWPADLTAKVALWPLTRARHVRLVSRAGTAGMSAAAELHVGGPNRPGTSTVRRGRCLARRSPAGPRNVASVRLGYTRAGFRRRLLVRPVRRTRRSWRWCVSRSRGRVTAVFGRRGGAELVTTTAGGHGNRSVRPGGRLRALRRAWPRRRPLGRGLFRQNRRSPRLVGVRGGRIRYVAVANSRLLRNKRLLRRYLELAGVEPAPKRRARKR